MPSGKMYLRGKRVGRPRTRTVKTTTTVTRRARGRGRVIQARASLGRVARGLTTAIIPMKFGYVQNISKTGTASPFFNTTVNLGLGYMENPDWYNKYHPMFQWVRINKARVEIQCPYNIGQQGVGGQSLYHAYWKTQQIPAETHPNDEASWLTVQSKKEGVFSGRKNSLSMYITPYQFNQGATVSKRKLYKEWNEVPAGPTGAIDYNGCLLAINKLDGSNISSAESFKLKITLYLQFKGIKTT